MLNLDKLMNTHHETIKEYEWKISECKKMPSPQNDALCVQYQEKVEAVKLAIRILENHLKPVKPNIIIVEKGLHGTMGASAFIECPNCKSRYWILMQTTSVANQYKHQTNHCPCCAKRFEWPKAE